MIKRLFPNRWARITAWTGAAVAWAVSVMAAAAQSPSLATVPETHVPDVAPTSSEITTATIVTMPTVPDSGLVVIRFTPVAPPAPQVVTRTVVVNGGGGENTRPPSTPPTTVPTRGS